MRGRRGNYAILMGTSVFVILGFSALAIDISLITMAELQAQATADAASHAALVTYRKTLSESDGAGSATFVVDRNPVAMGSADLDSIRFGSYDHEQSTFCVGCSGFSNVNAVEVLVSRQGSNAVDLLLAPLLGVETHEVRAESVTAQQQRAIMLVQDASCSMMGGSNAAIDIAREANLVFFDTIVASLQSGDMLGLAQYASDGAVAPELGGGGTSEWPAYHVAPWAPLVDIERNLPSLHDRILGICDTSGEGSCPGSVHPLEQDIGMRTNPGVAMEQAIGQLRDRTDATYFRAMVVFSDGEFNYGGGNGRALDAAELAWDTYDIHIWSILYANDGGGDPDVMAALVRGVGFFQDSPDVADLPAMYEEVAKSIPIVVVR